MIHDRRVALVIRICFFVLTLYGLCSYTGVFEGVFKPESFMFYTILSNALALLLFGGLTLRTAIGIKNEGVKGSAGYAPRFSMICSVDLLVTLLVYWVLLAPTAFTMTGSAESLLLPKNLVVHLFVPLFCVADWILFAQSRVLKFRDVFSCLIFPYLYVFFTSIAGAAGYIFRYTNATIDQPMHYPYFFLDWDTLGIGVLLYVAGLSVFFILLGCLFYLFDHKVKKPVLFGAEDKSARK